MSVLVFAALMVQLSAACTCQTNCSHVYDTTHGEWCMRNCGFAILRDVYSRELLDEINDAFIEWTRILENVQNFSLRDGYHLRGMRSEIGLPDIHPFNDRKVLYNRQVSQLVEEHFAGEDASLEVVTLLNNPSPSSYQPWHQDDGSTPFTVKVYVPLVDVTNDLGPVELNLFKYDIPTTMSIISVISSWISADDHELNAAFEEHKQKHGQEAPYHFAKQMGLLEDCTVKGIFERGTVMAYVNGLFHRGTPNQSGSNRTILHYSFMTSQQVGESRYMTAFTPHFQAEMSTHRRLYQQHRDEDQKCMVKKARHESTRSSNAGGSACEA